MVKKSQIQCIDVIHFSIDKKNDSCSDEVLNGNENLQEKTVKKTQTSVLKSLIVLNSAVQESINRVY